MSSGLLAAKKRAAAQQRLLAAASVEVSAAVADYVSESPPLSQAWTSCDCVIN